VARLYCNNQIIKKLIGFRPEIGIKEGLKRTIEWFVNPSNLKRIRQISSMSKIPSAL
jgi:nucleoside-diphosphate-sugar epimerase